MKRDEAGRIRARDQRTTDDEMLVPRELAPERGLEVHVLTNSDGANVGECGGRIGSRAFQRFDRSTANQQAKVMVAEAQLAGAHGVPGGEHLSAFGCGSLVGAAQTTEREVDALACRLALDRREALGNDELVWHAQQAIE